MDGVFVEDLPLKTHLQPTASPLQSVRLCLDNDLDVKIEDRVQTTPDCVDFDFTRGTHLGEHETSNLGLLDPLTKHFSLPYGLRSPQTGAQQDLSLLRG